MPVRRWSQVARQDVLQQRLRGAVEKGEGLAKARQQVRRQGPRGECTITVFVTGIEKHSEMLIFGPILAETSANP